MHKKWTNGNQYKLTKLSRHFHQMNGISCSKRTSQLKLDCYGSMLHFITHQITVLARLSFHGQFVAMRFKRTSGISNPIKICVKNNKQRFLKEFFMAYFSLFLHAFSVLLLWHATLATASLPRNHADHLALMAIKSSITHDPQRVLNTWNTSIHFCQWQGVTCGRRHPRVTILDLGTTGIAGSVSPHIGNLSFLRVIILKNNNLIGVIPPQVGNLFRLRLLNLMNSSFEGEVPPSLSNCSRLNALGLARNKLVGKLPQQLSSLVNLVKITLHNNGFTGGIPSFLGNLTSLEAISAANNYLGGSIPQALGQLYNLQQLGFANNQLSGIIPKSLYNLTSLIVFSFTDNQISGDLPKDIGLQIPNLEFFQIASNKFTGTIPFSFSHCSNLVDLNFGDNFFTGKVNIRFNQMPNLRRLGLYNNSLGSSEPDEMNFINSMVNCSKLELLLVHVNELRGVLPSSVGNLSFQLTTFSFAKNFIYGTLPSGIGNLVKLERLIMLNNLFTGIIPSELGSLRNLKLLYLYYNNFTGKIPDFLGNLSLLNELDLGVIGIFKNACVISVDGNSRLCGGISELRLPKRDILARSKKGSRRVMLVVIPLCSFLVLAIALSLLFYWKRRKTQAQPTERAHTQPFSWVSYGSILKATNEFSQQNLIGTGTFSAVYKGVLEPLGEMVAIKVLKLENQGALRSFMTECEALRNIRHRNLVKIITACSSIDFQGNDFKALIYEFMPNGNLESWLHPSSEQEVEIEEAPQRLVNLHQRLTIATDVAHAIHYLHQDCEVPIIHCDLKPSNILLDNDMVAHIGDFGFAKFLPLKPHESSSIGLRGTIGYAAPEYGLGSEMTKEGDIYSFGILLLEMMTGKRPTNPMFQEGLNLHSYVQMAFPDHVMEIVEPTLLSVYEEAANRNHGYRVREANRRKRLEDGMISLARIGLTCSKESPKDRI
ncbi:leucine-rich repeat protein [Artemisia annua]|uniref:non-specific serine/threonine protein kinase n=1 Tax=Artemisia annua TaxID=35608 RepID=A0A2U1LZ45_ARTAN|nr:leucine-rich repeat protein [Artemisia annua]